MREDISYKIQSTRILPLRMDLSGEEWNDYDNNGHSYWDYQWHVDVNTGDSWRLVKKENK